MPEKEAKKKFKLRKMAKKMRRDILTEKPSDEPSNRLFALDIGTRSVIGIVAESTADGLKILSTTRKEHKTRAMLDGQIHDVPQVASIINDVKASLEKETGKLSDAAVAAAGRALYTMTADAEMELAGVITSEQERRLDFAGVQAAQAKLSTCEDIDDISHFYCVGYSTIKYTLDGVLLKSLVGQRGSKAEATVIATFLPRQVIDSMHSALKESNLSMRALTLEPIAAINVLIPPTMRHLNLVLVDIGAGTSDVAVTKNGSVVAYGMVPLAGDEITEAISQKFLLDFNVAEIAKRDAASGKNAVFSDILGISYNLSPAEILEPVTESIKNLANAIAKQIIDLNGAEPQAVLLVGGGALTPNLAKFIAEALSLPEGRVAVRTPDNLDGMLPIPEELRSPDAVTPLGILKIASQDLIRFLNVTVNDEEYSLFNFRELTISDALLNAGIQLKKFNGRPGLSLTLTVNGKPKFFAGTMGTLARLTLDGVEATLDTPIADGSNIKISAGEDGTTPNLTLADLLLTDSESMTIFVNGRERQLSMEYLINGEKAEKTQPLYDGDTITTKGVRTLGEALKLLGYPPQGTKISYKLNDTPTTYTSAPEILLNDAPATISTTIQDYDRIEYIAGNEPKLGEVLSISEIDAYNVIYFNKAEYKIPSATISLTLNGRTATPNSVISEGCVVTYSKSEKSATIVSDALLAVGFEPPPASSKVNVEIRVNGKHAEFTDTIKNGDEIDTVITPIEDFFPTEKKSDTQLKDGLLAELLGKNI